MVQLTTSQELAKLLEQMEDAYWKLNDLMNHPDLSEDDNNKLDEITTSLDQFFA